MMKPKLNYYFTCDLLVAIEATAIVLKIHKKPIDYLTLLKILYVADTICLTRMDQPIIGGEYIYLKGYPVSVFLYDLIKGKSDNFEIWNKYICSSNENSIYLKKDSGSENLCDEAIEIIENVYNNFNFYSVQYFVNLNKKNDQKNFYLYGDQW